MFITRPTNKAPNELLELDKGRRPGGLGRWATQVEACGTAEFAIACASGAVSWLPQRCGVRWLCPGCRAVYYGRLMGRIVDAFEARGQEGYFLTLTTAHQGVEISRAEIAKGWARWRASAAAAGLGSPPYVLVWEVTPGRDRLGHVHAHVAWLYPGRLDYRAARRWWLLAAPSARVFFVQRMHGPIALRAWYLAKYVSKGVDVTAWPPEHIARLLDAWYRKRTVSASRAFWTPRAPRCPTCAGAYALATRGALAREVFGHTCAPPPQADALDVLAGPPEGETGL